MSLSEPRCRHEREGHILAGMRARLANESHVAELGGDSGYYLTLRRQIEGIDQDMATNLDAHRHECIVHRTMCKWVTYGPGNLCECEGAQ